MCACMQGHMDAWMYMYVHENEGQRSTSGAVPQPPFTLLFERLSGQ